MSTAVHPTDDTLSAFAGRKLPASEADAVHRHLDGCPSCRQQVADLSRAHETNPPAGTDLYAEVSRVVGRIADLPTVDDHEVPAELKALGHYADVKKLGQGGMGVVYLARNTLLDRLEVLKVANQELLRRAGTGAKERFLREMQSAAKLAHPNVVAAYAAYQQGDVLVFAMQYAPGESLADVVARKHTLSVSAACFYLHGAALGLQHAHEHGMVHRDIKPQNLQLTRDHKGKPLVKVLDFGLAKVVREASGDGMTVTGSMMGTPPYMAPEQWKDAAAADIRADVYSLGCTLYCLLTGRPPFRGTQYELMLAHASQSPTPVHAVRPEVPAGLSAVVDKMLAKTPADRYQTPAEVATAVRPFIKTRGRETPVEAGADVNPSQERATTELHESAAKALAETRSRSAAGATRRKWMWPVAAGVGLLAVVVAAVLSQLTPSTGIIVLEGIPDDAEVSLDGASVKGRRVSDDLFLTLAPGTHTVKVMQRGDELFVRDGVLVQAGGEPVRLRVDEPAIELEAAPAAPPPPEPPPDPIAPLVEHPPKGHRAFVPLLADGKMSARIRTTGSKGHTPWRLQGGELVGRPGGDRMVTLLQRVRDFEVRAEVMWTAGAGVFVFRTEPRDGRPRGYSVGLGRGNEVSSVGTISRWAFMSRDVRVLAGSTDPNLSPDVWCPLEVTARGNRFTAKVNGGPPHTAVDRASTWREGNLAFYLYPGATMKIRRIEFKSLDSD